MSATNTKSLADLEQKICQSAEDAVNAYNKAVHVLLSYNRDIEYIIDEAVNEIKPEIWDSIREKTRQKNECIRRAQEKADEATKDVNRLKELISSPDFDAPDNTKVIIRNNISKVNCRGFFLVGKCGFLVLVQVQDDVETAKRALAAELKHGNVTEKYWDKVEKARKNFSEELEILFPNVDISKKRLSVDQEDLDLFILHVYANVLFYQKVSWQIQKNSSGSEIETLTPLCTTNKTLPWLPILEAGLFVHIYNFSCFHKESSESRFIHSAPCCYGRSSPVSSPLVTARVHSYSIAGDSKELFLILRLTLGRRPLPEYYFPAFEPALFQELAKMETMLQSRVDHAVEEAKRGGLEPLTVAQICEAVEQEKRRLTACFQQQVVHFSLANLVRFSWGFVSCSGAEIAERGGTRVARATETPIAGLQRPSGRGD